MPINHTVDYDPKTMPLTLKFQRNANPDYFNQDGEFRDHLRNEVNDDRWRRISLILDIQRSPQ